MSAVLPLATDVLPLAAEMLVIVLRNFHIVLIGVLVGMFVGILPGMGGAVALALIIPFTFDMSSHEAFILLGSSMGATAMAGSMTAILVNTPGSGSNAATLLDGYPMARQGQAKDALGASALSSAAGAFVGLVAFLLMIPILREFALFFGSVEIFWLALFGIAIIPAATQGSLIKGLIAGGLGLMFAFHGFSVVTGGFRFEYIRVVTDSVQIIPAIIGLFAIAEMLNLASRGESIAETDADEENVEVTGSLRNGMLEVVRNKWLFARSAVIGFVVGAIPGAGGTVANFVAYVQAAQTRAPGDIEFGEGNIQGVIASESSNDSKDGGQLIPTFALGIPGGSSTAILLGAFIFHGFQPGPQFINEQLDIVLLVMLALLASNILTSIIALLIADFVSKIVALDIYYLFPTIIAFALYGSFITRNDFGDVIMAVIFGLIGFGMILGEVTRIPVVLALVLADIIEENLHRGLALGDNLWYFVDSTLSKILVAIVVLSMLQPLIQAGISAIRERAVGRS